MAASNGLFDGATVTTNSDMSGSFPGANVIDGDAGTFWHTSEIGVPFWIKFDLGDGITAISNTYRITSRLSNDHYPVDWTYEGSNNNVNWTVLDTRTSEAFSGAVERSFSCSNTTAYRYYRLNISATQSTSYCCIAEMGADTSVELTGTLNIQLQTSGTIHKHPDIIGAANIQLQTAASIHKHPDIIGALNAQLGISGAIHKHPDIQGVASIPLMSVYGRVLAGTTQGSLSATLPAITALGYCGGGGAATLPALTLAGSGLTGAVGSLSKSLPIHAISAHGYIEGIGAISASLPAITLSASGYQSAIGSLSRDLPALTISASGYSGIVGSLSKSLPPITMRATSSWLGVNALSKSLPAFDIEARASSQAADIIAFALNTHNYGLSKYTNFNYNSMCVFNGAVIGAKTGGIYELAGSTDDEAAIPWKLTTPKILIGESKVRCLRIAGKMSGDLKLVAELPDGTRYEYDAEPVSESEDKVRIKLGKGIKTKYITFELSNEAKETITIDEIRGHGIKK